MEDARISVSHRSKALSVDFEVFEHRRKQPGSDLAVGNRGESASDVETPVTALATCRIESEFQLVPSHVASRTSYEFSSVRDFVVVHERMSVNPGLP